MKLDWQFLHPRMQFDMLGYIPTFLDDRNPDPAAKQIARNYCGGWFKMNTEKFKLDPETMILRYPGDPPIQPLARTYLRDEELTFYEHELLMIRQKDGSWELARLD